MGVRNIKTNWAFLHELESRGTTSTFDDEWDLRWNFNIENKLGVGWHQYSCRVSSLSFLLETSGKDAKLI
jgi:hypothetical protein